MLPLRLSLAMMILALSPASVSRAEWSRHAGRRHTVLETARRTRARESRESSASERQEITHRRAQLKPAEPQAELKPGDTKHATLQTELTKARQAIADLERTYTTLEREYRPRTRSKRRSTEATDGAREERRRDTLVGYPAGQELAQLDEERCLRMLEDAGVRFRRIRSEQTASLETPIRLTGDVGGIAIESKSGSELHEILDCRLAVGLLSWAKTLRQKGVVKIGHYSAFRPGAHVGETQKESGHARGMAIDVAIVTFEDGTELDVHRDWENRERGVDPCAGIDRDARTLPSLVCSAVDEGTFQVVLTPHYDAAHSNHVHIELVPGVDWTYVH